MPNQAQKRRKLNYFEKAALLSALIVFMTVVPYTGYIRFGTIEITTLHIVVAVGAALLGWKGGAWLGFVWGAACFLRAFFPALQSSLVSPLAALVPRVAAGAAAGLAAHWLRKAGYHPPAAGALAAAAASAIHTLLVLSAMKLFFPALGEGSQPERVEAVRICLSGIIELAAAVAIVPLALNVFRSREVVLGVDLGASVTKLALVKNGRCLRAIHKGAEETLEEAVARLDASEAARAAVTGVGAASFKGDVLNLPTRRVDEFAALSRGASRSAKKRNCLVVSIGTGTCFLRVTPFRFRRVGGTGLGGGMLQGLAERLCGVEDMQKFCAMAQQGDLSRVDLQLRDVCAGEIPGLTPATTVANLRKAGGGARGEDLAAGLCNMVFEGVGVMAALAANKCLTHTVVLVGTIAQWPVAKHSLDGVASLHRVRFVVPEYAPFATAIGAAMAD